MIAFDQISKLFTFDTKKRFCVEIPFMLSGSEKFDYCWMGKMWSKEEQRDVYWYGLTQDGKNAYDYAAFEDMANAPVFDGFCLREVWDRIAIEEIDGCDPMDVLFIYKCRRKCRKNKKSGENSFLLPKSMLKLHQYPHGK